ncbi:DUF6268 family outer membrane beta-barrel protein [Aquimarina agarivorans]|uniref:DUF6268 family outer membrane beta-barrel protein n=1 Tax=Aquimarina agarivorans TaxID=980584 RepID=UPI000248FAE0|nr:DUF6268 family outer membrane beta-barrel protein [Aquimarina agarivorans]
MKYFLAFNLFFLISTSIFAQLTDLTRLEYTYFPQRNSDNNFQRIRALVKLPLKLNDKGAFLVPGFEYRNVRFDFEDATNFDTNNLNNFNSYDITLGYTFKIKKYLRFAAKSGVLIASNFEGDGVITNDDLLYSGAVVLIKDKTGEGEAKKPWRWVIGLQYSTKAGIPIPLPFINYYKQFAPKWSYGLGVPKSNIKYYLNDKNVFQAFATLDGFFANIQKDRVIPNSNGTNTATTASISMTVALGGLGFEHLFTDHLVLYAYTGFTFLNDIRLRDNNQDDVFTINDTNTFYIRGGLKFKL